MIFLCLLLTGQFQCPHMLIVFMVISEASVRTTETWNRLLSVNKILNGGGSLSVELLKDAIQIFPRSKILSAYGRFSSSSPDFIY